MSYVSFCSGAVRLCVDCFLFDAFVCVVCGVLCGVVVLCVGACVCVCVACVCALCSVN